MSRATIKKNLEAAHDLASTWKKLMNDMGASGIGADSPSDSPVTYPYATSNDEYKGDDEGDGEDDYELDNNCEYIPVNESEEEEETNYLEDKKEKEREKEKRKDVADEDQQSAAEPTKPLDAPSHLAPATFSSPAPSRKKPVALTHTPKKRKVPAAMLGTEGLVPRSRLHYGDQRERNTKRQDIPARSRRNRSKRNIQVVKRV
ncbi:hypothetical protein V7S43_008509 [Phytophthora oleae]|uniref:TFIIS N-terminal domain-containing protein n=1 Tax=Phytophthora oleae TaxID=2107226 RepID=A0ABD3FH41_9STRA